MVAQGQKKKKLFRLIKKKKGGEKSEKPKPKRVASYPLLWPLGTDQPVLPPPPTKETREVKEN